MAKTLDLATVPAYDRTWKIQMIRGTNPKTKPGSKSWLAFEHFFEAETVGDFADAHGKGWRSEIEWCVARRFVALIDPVEAEAEAEEAEAEEAEAEEELADAE